MDYILTTDWPAKPNRTRRYIILATVLFLILAFITVGFITNWFGLYGPATKIARASMNTFKAESFTADFQISNGDVYIEGTLQLYTDPEDETVEAYLEANYGKTTYIAAIYDEVLIYGTEKKHFSKDISSQLQDYFSKQKKTSKKIGSMDDMAQFFLDLIPEQLQDEIDESYLDLDETKHLLKSFLTQKLNRTSWLKKHAEYESYRVNGVQYHRFKSKKGQLLEDTVEHFESAFKSERLLSQLQESAETMQTSHTSTQMLIAIKDGRLRKLEIVTSNSQKSSSFVLSFRKIGSTKLDQELLSSLSDA